MNGALLAFDTSTELMAVALAAGGVERCVDEAGGALASAALLPRIHALLVEAGIGVGAVEAIAFGRGPGAFTGLRTSCAVAQGLGFGLGRPLIAVDSLLIVAEDARAQLAPDGADFEVGVLMDARMDEAYAARYRWSRGAWTTVSAPALYALDALAAAWTPPPPCIAGSGVRPFAGRIGLAPGLLRVEGESSRAAALLRLARAQRADAVAAADALPLYLRDKVALTTREREAAREARA